MFKKPKNVEEYITIWGWMDSVVCATKRGAALSYWKRNSVPLSVCGESFRVRCGGRIVALRYSHVIVNRFWYKDFFAQDMRNYERLYRVFATAVGFPALHAEVNASERG